MQKSPFKSEEIHVGYHPDGYRIDKTAPPLYLYTKWIIEKNGGWHSPKAVCFHSLPEDGWSKTEGFDWGAIKERNT